jgi:hypothetical protein
MADINIPPFAQSRFTHSPLIYGGGIRKAAAGPATPASLAFLQAAADGTNQTTYNFASQNFGDEDATREIVVTVHWYGLTGASALNSASIGGVSATIHVQNNDDLGGAFVGSAIISASVPTGTSGTISVTFSAQCLGAAIGAYRVINLSSTTPHHTASDDDDVINMSLNIPENGVLVACAMFETAGVVATSGMTEDFDATLESAVQYVGGSGTGLSQETGRALSFDGAVGPNGAAGVAASWA